MEQQKQPNPDYPELAGFIKLTVKEPEFTGDKGKAERYFPIDVIVEFGNHYFVTKHCVIEVEESVETIMERIRISRRMLTVEKMSATLPSIFKIPNGGKILKFAPADPHRSTPTESLDEPDRKLGPNQDEH